MANRSVCSNESVKASGFSTTWRAEGWSRLRLTPSASAKHRGYAHGVSLLNEAAARRTGLDILRRTDDCRAAMKHANVNIKFETVVSGLFSQIETAA